MINLARSEELSAELSVGQMHLLERARPAEIVGESGVRDPSANYRTRQEKDKTNHETRY